MSEKASEVQACSGGGTGQRRGLLCRLRSLLGMSGSSGKELIVISSDVMGREADIGAVLMKGFFQTMRESGQLPGTMFFLNAGVKLTTLNDDTVPALQAIAESGVEIFSCGTCLKHFDIEDKLRVGYPGTTAILLEKIADAAKVVWV
jgi:selenium metabolism protein YedF